MDLLAHRLIEKDGSDGLSQAFITLRLSVNKLSHLFFTMSIKSKAQGGESRPVSFLYP